MTTANLCEQCKAHATPPWSQRESPCGSSAGNPTSCLPQDRGAGAGASNPTSCFPRDRGAGASNPTSSKPVYVRMGKTCIVLGKGDDCGATNISLQLPSPGFSKLRLKCGEGAGSGSSGGNCIEIMGNSIIKSAKGGLQIVPAKGKGGMQISLGKGGSPVLHLGAGSAPACSTGSGGLGGVKVSPGGGQQLQLSFGKQKSGGGPSISFGPGGSNVEISYGPQKRKLDMNHCKPTIAFMIHKRLVELETEQRMAECAYGDLHP